MIIFLYNVDMTYEQLRVLQSIVNEGTFRAAAEKLHKSQPALSNTIKKLEQECGFELFSRDQYRPQLTDEGQVFYEKAQLALNQMHQLTALSKHIAKKEELMVRIAVNALCPLKKLLATLKNIETEFPATQLDLSTESMGGAMERLLDDEVDIAITTQTGIEASYMEAITFTPVRILQVAHRNYPLVTDDKFNAASEVSAYIQLVVADSSQHNSTQSHDVLQGVRHWRVSDISTNKEIILSGMAWGGMPEHMIKKELSSGELVPVHVEGIEPRISQLYLIRRTDKPIGLVADAIWQALLKSEKIKIL